LGSEREKLGFLKAKISTYANRSPEIVAPKPAKSFFLSLAHEWKWLEDRIKTNPRITEVENVMY
jgi:hypothetical protein